jgi:hypothetical protein
VRLAGANVSRALEALAPTKPVTGVRQWHHGEALRAAAFGIPIGTIGTNSNDR